MRSWRFGWFAALALLAASAGSAAAQPAVSAWPLFHRDVHRTGRTTVVGPAAPNDVRQVWKGFGALRSSPVIGPDGTVYQGSGTKWCAIDPTVGIPIPEKWCTEMTGTVVLANPGLGIDPINPALTRAYIGARDARLHAFDQNGMLLWYYSLGIDGDVAAAPVFGSDGSIFFGGSTRIHSLDKFGNLQWLEGLDAYVYTAAPVIAPNGRLYVATLRGTLYAFAPSGTNANKKWQISLGGNVRFASPAVGPDGTIYIGTRDGLVAVQDNDTSATIKWTFEMGGRGVVSAPASDTDGTLYVGGQGTVVAGATFFAINPNGTQKWASSIPKFSRGSPVLDGAGRIYATSGRDIVAFNAASGGAPLWTYSTGRNIYASPALAADGTLWIGSGDRWLYAISD
jgi:outer membrane protein assembly factor BamB